MANERGEILKVGAILFIITAVAALILAVVNNFTAPVIAENNKRAEEAAMKLVLPGADSFDKIDFTADESSSVREIYQGGEAGAVVKVAPVGYNGNIDIVVGIDNDLKVTGIQIINQTETAGLGANCTKDIFKAQFVGKTENITVAKNGATGNEIDAISSATITSKAVTKGVNDALSAVKEMKGDK